MAEDHGHDEHGGGEGGEHKPHKSHGSHGPGHGGGHEEHAGAPEWLISFADNTALLMGFFVILLAMNMAPKKEAGGSGGGPGPGGITPEQAKMIDLQWGILEAFNNRPRADSADPAMRKLYADYHRLHGQDGPSSKRNNGAPGKDQEKSTTHIQTTVKPNLVVEFDQGSALFSPARREEIGALVERELIGKGWVIEVRGHVSAAEARSAERRGAADRDGGGGGGGAGSGAGYALSFQRAYAVADEMARRGVPWRQMRIVACSDMERAVQRADSDPKQHRLNQRVEVILTSDELPPDPLSEPVGN